MSSLSEIRRVEQIPLNKLGEGAQLILARCWGRGFTIYYFKGWIFLKSPFHKDYVNEGVPILSEGFLYKRLIDPAFWNPKRFENDSIPC